MRTELNQFEILVSSFIHEIKFKNELLWKKTALRENHINRESKNRSSQFSHADVMNNTKLLAVVTPQYIYQFLSRILYGYSTKIPY